MKKAQSRETATQNVETTTAKKRTTAQKQALVASVYETTRHTPGDRIEKNREANELATLVAKAVGYKRTENENERERNKRAKEARESRDDAREEADETYRETQQTDRNRYD